MTIRETPATLLATLIAATIVLGFILGVTVNKAWCNVNAYQLERASQ